MNTEETPQEEQPQIAAQEVVVRATIEIVRAETGAKETIELVGFLGEQ